MDNGMPATMGRIAQTFEGGKGTLEEIKARVAAAEAQGSLEPPAPPAPEATPESKPQEQNSTPPVEEKLPENTVKVPPKFQDKDGQLDETKLLKANEHLDKGIEERKERTARLLKEHKELREKYRQSTEEAKQAENTKPEEPIDYDNLTPEFKAKLEEDFQKDFIGTQVRLQKAFAQREYDRRFKPVEQTINEFNQRARDRADMEEIDSLIDEGHTWIADEGLGRFDKVFAERPYLMQSPTKFRDAILFIRDIPLQKNAALGSTQPNSSPILGAGSAIPPPSQKPAITVEATMDDLSRQIKVALSQGDRSGAAKLLEKMEALNRAS